MQPSTTDRIFATLGKDQPIAPVVLYELPMPHPLKPFSIFDLPRHEGEKLPKPVEWPRLSAAGGRPTVVGRRFMTSFKQQLVEASLVSIPANPNASVVAKHSSGRDASTNRRQALHITFSGSGAG